MSRKVSTKKYLLALILTIIIFTLGIFLGILFEDLRLSDSERLILEEKANLRSLQIQEKYIDSGIADCNTLNKILESNLDELTKKMGRVISYKNNAVFSQDKFHLQLQDYFLTEIQFLLLSQDIDKKCSQDTLKIIFFYDENQFDTQGSILDYVKKIFGSQLLIFSFDSNFKQEPMIDVLLSSYKIKQFPSLVIDDTVLQGHTNVRDLMKEVCVGLSKLELKDPEIIEIESTKRICNKLIP